MTALLMGVMALCVCAPGNDASVRTDTLNGPVAPTVDLRNMLRSHIARQSQTALEQIAQKRKAAFAKGEWQKWRDEVRARVGESLGAMPFGPDSGPVSSRIVSRHECKGYAIENVLFESWPGWEVNASVYLPDPASYPPPWRALVIPVGHSGKQMDSYQIPAQVFARLGYVAVLFDPPGVSGEKQPGNDHFRDGVRSYLTGTSSNRYFVLDALRCVDYLATRSDVDMSNGVGMTGVSGGGITTMMATLLDDRITASGPACCAVSNIMHPVLDGYAPCPETLAANRFREYDDNDLLAAACPTPLLLMAGAQDEVFQGAWSDTIAADTRAMYEKAAKNDRFAYFSDPGGHAYTVAMAVEFTKWMDQWVALRARTIPALSEKDFVMDPPELLRCSPNTSVNMFTINRDLARKLREGYAPATPVAAIRDVLGISGTLSAPEYRANPDTLAWFHWMREMMLMPEPGIELPCTYLRPSRKDWKGAAVLWIDEQGRWTGLRQQGFLSTLTGFIDRETNGPALLTVDCRGWGDTAPAHIAYDMPGWAGRDRWMAYVSAALGDSVFAMRVRDGLAALAWLRAQPEIDPGRVSVGGRGMGAVVAAHVAAVAGDCARLAMLEPLAAFGLLAESEAYAWDHEAFAPGVLKRYDLPQLVNGLTAPVLIVNPLNAEKKAMNSKQLGAVSDAYGSKVTWVADVESGKAQAEIVAFLK